MPFIVDVKVVEGSNHMRWELHGTSLVCHHKKPDDSHQVNTDIINAIAFALGVTHGKVHIVHGIEERHKRFKISEVNATHEKLLQGLKLA
jgi:uncharacterized protein YggU (UPF0235/DUF167 family)